MEHFPHGYSMLKLLKFALVLMILGIPVYVEAEEATQEMTEKADEAAKHFKLGHFSKAAKGFADAFSSFKDYNLKKNEMIAWFKAGKCTNAIEAGNLFLKGDGEITKFDRSDVKTVKVKCLLLAAEQFLNLGSVEDCEKQLDEAEGLMDSDSVPPVKGAEESNEIKAIRGKLELIKEKRKPEPEPELETAPGGGSLLGPSLALGGGVLAIGGGVLLFFAELEEDKFTCSKNVASPSCKSPTESLSRQEFDDLKASANTFNTLGWIGLSTGIGMSVLGTYLWLSEEGTKGSIALDPLHKNIRIRLVY